LDSRPHTGQAPTADEWIGTGRELFASMRAGVGPADEGATIFRSAV
jgi:phosphogluconate dehydratase